MAPIEQPVVTRTVSGFIAASCPLLIVERVIPNRRRATYVVGPIDPGTGSAPEVPLPHQGEIDL
jgi:hypothetical protein